MKPPHNAPGYPHICRQIAAAPSTGLWSLLKEELRLHKHFMRLHHRLSPCWHNKQRARIIRFFRVVSAKEPISNTPATPLQTPCKPPSTTVHFPYITPGDANA